MSRGNSSDYSKARAKPKWTFSQERVLFRIGDLEGTYFVIVPDQIADVLDSYVGCTFPIICHNGREGRARLNADHSVSLI